MMAKLLSCSRRSSGRVTWGLGLFAQQMLHGCSLLIAGLEAWLSAHESLVGSVDRGVVVVAIGWSVRVSSSSGEATLSQRLLVVVGAAAVDVRMELMKLLLNVCVRMRREHAGSVVLGADVG